MSSSDVAAVLAAEAARRTAVETLDRDRLDALLTADFLYVHGSGRTEDKATYVRALGTGVNRYLSYTPSNVVVRLQADSALVSGEFLATGVSGASPVKARFRFVGLWVRDGGQWRISFYQNTKFKNA